MELEILGSAAKGETWVRSPVAGSSAINTRRQLALNIARGCACVGKGLWRGNLTQVAHQDDVEIFKSRLSRRLIVALAQLPYHHTT